MKSNAGASRDKHDATTPSHEATKQYNLNLMYEFPVIKTFADEHLEFARNLGDY